MGQKGQDQLPMPVRIGSQIDMTMENTDKPWVECTEKKKGGLRLNFGISKALNSRWQ